MRNLMMLRSVRTLTLAAALGAACGGSDPPGGGNNGGTTDGGDTADGTTGNGGTDGHIPNPNNPLIVVIPGTWELIAIDLQDGRGWMELQPDDPDRLASVGPVAVDSSDPDCDDAAAPYLGPPGDACIDWGENREPTFFILDDDTVRADLGNGTRPHDGRVLDGGRRIEYNMRAADVNGRFALLRFRKIE